MDAPGRAASATAELASRRPWSAPDYLPAMVATAAMIAPVPFFWNPPFWVPALMMAPARSR